MKALIATTLLFGAPLGVFCQQTVDLPPGPLVQKRAPETNRWIITYNPQKTAGGGGESEAAASGTKGKRAPFSRRIVYTKSGAFVCEQVIAPDGKVRERWIVGDYQFDKDPKTKRFNIYSVQAFVGGKFDGVRFTDLSKTDFPGFEWIGPKDYAGVQKVMNRECLVFHRADGEEATAYVDAATRYPVVLKRGNETRLYEFQKAPQIALPAEIQKELAARAPAAKKAH